SLNNREGVQEASVNLATQSASVAFDGQQISEADLKEAIEAAGYSVVDEEIQTRMLKVEGMHCASCVNSVQQALEQMDGVQEASVKLATESAQVSYTGNLTLSDFDEAVERAGYELLRDPEYSEGSSQSKAEAKQQREQEKLDRAWNNMWWAWALTIPIMLWMIPEMIWGYAFLGDLGFEAGMILLSAIVIFVPGLETTRSAWKSAKNLTPNMDVLIAM